MRCMEHDPDEKSPYLPEVRQYATDLLGYLNKKGGTVPGSFTVGVFELWAKADFINKGVIESAWPFIGCVLRANEEGGPKALRRIAGITK
jgi:hypothetical protein